MSVERQRGRIVTAFVVLNVVQDVVVAVANVCQALAASLNNVSLSLRFAQYDQARKYQDLTGGDFGEVIGCPGHYTGQCSHRNETGGEE